VAAPFGIQVGVVQMGAQQREQRAITLGEVRAGPAEEEQPHGPPTPLGSPWRFGQAQLELMLDPLRPVIVAVRAGGMPLPPE
jgi:hypothetical protein